MIIDELLDYWVQAQRIRSLHSPQAKEVYIHHRIKPLVEREQNPRRKALFERLMSA